MTDILQAPAMRGFIRMCMDGWDWGWHERNGGNEVGGKLGGGLATVLQTPYDAPGIAVFVDLHDAQGMDGAVSAVSRLTVSGTIR